MPILPSILVRHKVRPSSSHFRQVSRAVQRKIAAGKLKAMEAISPVATTEVNPPRFGGDHGPRRSFVSAIICLGLFPIVSLGAISMVNDDMRELVRKASWSWQTTKKKND